MNLGGCGHGAPPPSTGTARTDPVSRSSISRPMVTQELGFPYPCSLALSPWRLPGGEAPLGSNRIAPDFWSFPWVSHLPSQSLSGLLALLPFHSISALPGHPPSLSSASSHNPLISPDCPALHCRFSGISPLPPLAGLPGFSGPESSVLRADLPSSVHSPIRVSPFLGPFYDSSWKLSGSEQEVFPGEDRTTSPYPVQLHLGLVRRISGLALSRLLALLPAVSFLAGFAVRYVHWFCLMFPPDIPSLVMPLPFRPATAGSYFFSACLMPGNCLIVKGHTI